MEGDPDLDALYSQARAALAAGERDRARDLLKRIVLADENYKDTSRLLAGLVAERRRQWYRDWRLWCAWVAAATVGAFALQRFVSWHPLSNAPPPEVIGTVIPSESPVASASSLTPAPISGPPPGSLSWVRISMVQEFSRATIAATAVDPDDPDVLYVGTQGAGIYKSIDSGLSWTPAHSGLGHAFVDTLVIDPAHPRVLYAGVLNDGVYKTTDGGETWRALQGGFDLRVKEIASIVVLDPSDSRRLLYSPAFSLYESSDGGETWERIAKPLCPEAMRNLVIDPMDSRTLLAFDVGGQCTNGIYRTTDGGKTWALTSLQLENETPGGLAIDQGTGAIALASTYRALYRSSDSGESWELAGQFGCKELVFAPGSASHAYCASGDGVKRTVDGGQTWTPLAGTGPGTAAVVGVSSGTPGSLIIGGSGVHISQDGGSSWKPRGDGLGAARFELKLSRQDPMNVYAEEADSCLVRQSSDGSRTWRPMDTEAVGKRACFLEVDASGEFLYLGGGKGSYLRSSNGGESWATVTMPGEGQWLRVAADPRKPGALVAVDWPVGIFTSSDGGESWEKTSSISTLWEAMFFFSPSADQVIYAVGNGFSGAARSDDGGKTWASCAAQGAQDVSVTASDSRLAIDPLDADHLFLATSGNGVLTSRDGCQGWFPTNDGLTNLFVNGLAVDTTSPDTIYAATDGGAFVSFDAGAHWAQINDGLLGATVIYSIVVDPQSMVYAATPYGVFRLEAR